jgi:hypothetical protein
MVPGLSENEERRRQSAVRRLKLLAPLLFALGFFFYVAITIYPLAGMPAPPLSPLTGMGPALLWFGIACASGGLFALFGMIVVVVSASNDD